MKDSSDRSSKTLDGGDEELKKRVKALEDLVEKLDMYAYDDSIWAKKLCTWAVAEHKRIEKLESRESDPPPPPPVWHKPKPKQKPR